LNDECIRRDEPVARTHILRFVSLDAEKRCFDVRPLAIVSHDRGLHLSAPFLTVMKLVRSASLPYPRSLAARASKTGKLAKAKSDRQIPSISVARA
jgi:hypothetical protein